MSWRRTITYWTLFGVLLAFYWFVDRTPEAPTIENVRKERFLTAFRDEVTAVELVRDGKTVRCEKNDKKRWIVVDPKNVEIPSDLVTAMVDNLTEYQVAEVVRKKAKDSELGQYGLDQPGTEVRVLTGETTTSFVFGGTNPPRTGVYAKTSRGPQIYLVGLNLLYYTDLLYSSAYH